MPFAFKLASFALRCSISALVSSIQIGRDIKHGDRAKVQPGIASFVLAAGGGGCVIIGYRIAYPDNSRGRISPLSWDVAGVCLSAGPAHECVFARTISA